MNLINEISKIVSKSFSKSGYDEKLGIVLLSNRPDLCQFTCNGAMAGAKLYKKKPIDIANQICDELIQNEIFSKVEAVMPGFINITLANNYLEKLINNIKKPKDLINEVISETIVIDFGGANVAKPLHVGHLRTAIIGESLKRVGRFLGHNVIGDVHLGDWGLQMGLVITEIKHRNPDLYYFKEDYIPSEKDSSPVTVEQLNEIYPFASKKSKEDEDYKKEATDATKRLQNKEKGYYELWKQIVKISITDMKKIYEKLNVDFDYWYGESSAEDTIDELIEILSSKNLMYESDGALVVDISQPDDKMEMPPVLIKKSDGATLYATTDLATIIQRKKEFNPNQILYVVDNRQGFHFNQVFRCAKKACLVDESLNLEFVGFGTVNGIDGKPYKTRDGGTMKLEDLITSINQAAYEKVKENLSDDINESEKLIVAEKIGMAALKFGDLYNHRSRDYIFDIDRFLSFEGKTGPYLLYSVARINSILRKISNFEDEDIKLYSNTEIEIVLKILLTDDILNKSFKEKAPNYICEHIYDICTLFSRFYDENKIISEKDIKKKNSWIHLLLITKNTISCLLDLIGIDVVEKM